MTDDPGISNTNSSTRNLDTNRQTNKPNEPYEPRWKGGRPDITPGGKRALAIAAKRRWAVLRALLDKCASAERVFAAYYAGELETVVKLDAVLAVIPLAIVTQMRGAHFRVLLRLVQALVGLDVPGVKLTHAQIGELAMLSERQARRIVAELVAWELVHPEPDHEPDLRDPRGLAAFRAGNAYVPTGALLSLVLILQGSRGWPKNGQASGTEHGSASSSPAARRLGDEAQPPDPECVATEPGKVEPDCPESRLASHESPDVFLPETPDETRNVDDELRTEWRRAIERGDFGFARTLLLQNGGPL